MDTTTQASTIPNDRGEDPFRYPLLSLVCVIEWGVKYFLEKRKERYFQPNGNQKNTLQSAKVLEYVDYFEKMTGNTLLHYGKGREEVKWG